MNQELKKNISIETMSAVFIIAFVSLFILANLTIGFVWPLYLLAMILAFGISVKFPRSGLFAIVFLTMIFERFFALQTFFIGKVEYKIYPLDILMAGIILGIAAQYLFGAAKKICLQKIDYILLAFVFLNIIYFFASTSVFGGDKTLAFSTLKNYGFYSLFYFITLFLIRDKDDLWRLGKFFLASAIGIIIFIIIGVLRGEGLWSEFTPLSTSGIRLLAFTHGLYLSLAIIPALLMLVFKDRILKKPVYVKILILIWTFGIIATLMRHLWIALALAALLAYFLLPKEKKVEFRKIIWNYSAILFVILIIVFYCAALGPQSKLSGRTQGLLSVVAERTESLGNIGSDESYYWRTLVWKSAYEKFKSTPLFGIGTGQKVYVENGKIYKDFVEVRNIHNSYLAMLIQFGFLGLAIFIYFIYKIWKGLLKAYQKNKNNFSALSVLSILTLYIIAIFFQPYLETNLLSIFFWIALGLARNITYEPR